MVLVEEVKFVNHIFLQCKHESGEEPRVFQ